jgi:hypothetical protein
MLHRGPHSGPASLTSRQLIDMIAGLDGRLDLLELSPVEFEHLVRQL